MIVLELYGLSVCMAWVFHEIIHPDNDHIANFVMAIIWPVTWFSLWNDGN